MSMSPYPVTVTVQVERCVVRTGVWQESDVNVTYLLRRVAPWAGEGDTKSKVAPTMRRTTSSGRRDLGACVCLHLRILWVP